ncbi:MAG: hypothetical protein GXY58_00785 [Planctomycetaceae bacterium]|nr:hypothetical protein [Planctomycetaceae bacterium]
MWSLGNEAGNGENFQACYQWVKQRDPSALDGPSSQPPCASCARNAGRPIRSTLAAADPYTSGSVTGRPV